MVVNPCRCVLLLHINKHPNQKENSRSTRLLTIIPLGGLLLHTTTTTTFSNNGRPCCNIGHIPLIFTRLWDVRDGPNKEFTKADTQCQGLVHRSGYAIRHFPRYWLSCGQNISITARDWNYVTCHYDQSGRII